MTQLYWFVERKCEAQELTMPELLVAHDMACRSVAADEGNATGDHLFEPFFEQHPDRDHDRLARAAELATIEAEIARRS